MKCLSLIQPWASLLCMGIKTIETRSWPTTHRGLLYIHASKTYSPEGHKLWNKLAEIDALCVVNTPIFEALPRGAVIGHVKVEECLLMTEKLISDQNEIERLVGDWKVGRFAWKCTAGGTLSEPIPAKGSLQLWDFDPNAPQPVPVPSQSQLFMIRKTVQRRRRKKKGIVVEQDVFLENDPILNPVHRKFSL